jgi:anaerobic ribonucleoside-triphosphate reductase activating protein
MLTVAKYDRYDLVNNPGDKKPSFTIWFSGCTIRCNGCQNKSLWDFSDGEPTSVEDVVSIVVSQAEKIDFNTVVLLGGEPLDQGDLMMLCHELYVRGFKVWLYTGYDMDEIPSNIMVYLSTIKCGRYKEDLKCNGKLATSNQQMWHKTNDEWERII